MRFAFVLVGLGALLGIAGLLLGVWALWGAPAQGAPPLPRVFSIRHEPGANGHTLTTTAFPVRGSDGNVYLCVVTEDEGSGPSDTPIALSQSCDFSVAING